jgi:glycosyltransferase involved in cell wall biosynthesis
MRRLTVGPYPDEFVGWVRPAVAAGERLAQTTTIDVIMSYCPPESNHLIARQLSRRLGIPWVPFFGDLYGFLEPPLPAYSIESLARRAWHRWCMRPAAACVGISPAMTSYLEKTYRKRAELLHAGFDPSEFPDDTPEAPARSDRFVVSHVGSLYPGDQMPELFFDGLDLLLTRAPDLKSMIEVRFVGSKCEDQLHAMIRDRPSREVCTILPRVDSATAVELVRSSAALLAFTCTATRGRFGTMSYPTKVFEALGARRPVLVVPTDDDWVAHLVSETGGGRTIRDANEIADILMGWYREWARAGTVPYGGRNEVRAGFTQQRQAARLVELFEEVSSR